MEQTSNESESKHVEGQSGSSTDAAWQQKVFELEQLQAELAQERAALRTERDAWNAQRQQQPRQDASSFAEDVPDQGVAMVDQSPDHEEEEETDFQPEQNRAACAPPQSIVRGGDSEESVEEYMAALLTRMRGGGPASIIVPEPTRRPQRTSEPVQIEEKPPVEPSPPAVVEEVPVIIAPQVTKDLERRAKREVTDLSAMRELANAHARMAIHTHGRKQLVNVILIRSAAAIACLAAGFIALRIWPVEHKVLFGCGMAGIVAGIYWMFAAASDVQKILNWFESRKAQIALESDQAAARAEAASSGPDASQPASA